MASTNMTSKNAVRGEVQGSEAQRMGFHTPFCSAKYPFPPEDTRNKDTRTISPALNVKLSTSTLACRPSDYHESFTAISSSQRDITNSTPQRAVHCEHLLWVHPTPLQIAYPIKVSIPQAHHFHQDRPGLNRVGDLNPLCDGGCYGYPFMSWCRRRKG